MNKFEAEKMINDNELSFKQLENIRKIIDVLSKYIFVNRDIMNYRAKQKIGLSYIKKAVDLDLIVQLYDLENEAYYYKLAQNAKFLLDKNSKKYNEIDVFSNVSEFENLIKLNLFLMKEKKDFTENLFSTNAFINKKTKEIYYFKESISQKEILRNLANINSNFQKMKDMYNFIEIKTDKISISNESIKSKF